MKNIHLINTANLSDTNELKFNNFMPSVYDSWVDVMFKGNRIAIINGMSSGLQWTAKNGSNIPVRIINKIEKYCKNNIINR